MGFSQRLKVMNFNWKDKNKDKFVFAIIIKLKPNEQFLARVLISL